MTQERLAKLIGIHRASLAKYETALEDQVPPRIISAAAAALNVREEYFYAKDVDGPPFGYRLSDPSDVEPTTGSRAAQGLASGAKVLLRCFRGVVAGLDGDDEAAYVEEDLPRAVPAFFTEGDSERHDVLVVRGHSMFPRVPSGAEVIVRHDHAPRPGQIVVARDPEGRTFLKVLRIDGSGREFLASCNEQFPPIKDISGWECLAVAIAIITITAVGSQQMEWDEGRPLRA